MPDHRSLSDFIPETLACSVALIGLAALTAWSVGWLASDPLAAASCGKSDVYYGSFVLGVIGVIYTAVGWQKAKRWTMEG